MALYEKAKAAMDDKDAYIIPSNQSGATDQGWIITPNVWTADGRPLFITERGFRAATLEFLRYSSAHDDEGGIFFKQLKELTDTRPALTQRQGRRAANKQK